MGIWALRFLARVPRSLPGDFPPRWRPAPIRTARACQQPRRLAGIASSVRPARTPLAPAARCSTRHPVRPRRRVGRGLFHASCPLAARWPAAASCPEPVTHAGAALRGERPATAGRAECAGTANPGERAVIADQTQTTRREQMRLPDLTGRRNSPARPGAIGHWTLAGTARCPCCRCSGGTACWPRPAGSPSGVAGAASQPVSRAASDQLLGGRIHALMIHPQWPLEEPARNRGAPFTLDSATHLWDTKGGSGRSQSRPRPRSPRWPEYVPAG